MNESDAMDPAEAAVAFLEVIQHLDATRARIDADRARAIDLFRQASTRAAEERRTAVPEGEIPVRAARSNDLIARSIRAELAVALRVSERSAESLLGRSQQLIESPRLIGAMDAGVLSEVQARIVIDGLAGVSNPVLRDELEIWVVDRGVELRPGELGRRLRERIEAHRPLTLQERHDEAVAHRRVWVEDLPDGMSELGAVLPSVQAHAIYDRITRITRAVRDVRGDRADRADRAGVRDATADAGTDESAHGVAAEIDPRSTDQVRADVLVDLLIDGEVSTAPTAARGIRAEVCVTVPVSTLAGGDAPANLDGHVPVDPDTARELAAGCPELTRILTHPETGVVLSVGRETYRPPRWLRRAIRYRDGRCRFPGCTRPARLAELDHSIAWEHGGRTDLTNLAALCTGHHTLKHAGPWRVRHTEAGDGTLEWTSPLGQVVMDEPANAFAATIGAPAPF